MTRTHPVSHDPLEPSPTLFRMRNELGICVDCGDAPQPARRDGQGRHHRCDACRVVYDKRQRILARLKSGRWSWGVCGSARVCGTCRRQIPADKRIYALGGPSGTTPADQREPLCTACATDSGYDALLQAETGARLSSIGMQLTRGSKPGPLAAHIHAPAGVPRAAQAALTIGLTIIETEGDAIVHTGDTNGDTIELAVQLGSRTEPLKFAARIAVELTAIAGAVHVPAPVYKACRAAVYDAAGLKIAKRLKRDDHVPERRLRLLRRTGLARYPWLTHGPRKTS